jgi:hypothetical protein
MSGYIKTGVSDYGAKPSPKPSGKVCTDGKASTANLPARTTGSASIPEVTYDENAGLPSRTGGK